LCTLRPLALALLCLMCALLWTPRVANAQPAETAQLVLRLDRAVPQLTVDLSTWDLARRVGRMLEPGEPLVERVDAQLASADAGLAARLGQDIRLVAGGRDCTIAQVRRESLPAVRSLALYQRLHIEWQCPVTPRADDWQLAFRLLDTDRPSHVARGVVWLPDGRQQPLVIGAPSAGAAGAAAAPAAAPWRATQDRLLALRPVTTGEPLFALMLPLLAVALVGGARRTGARRARPQRRTAPAVRR
jgi:hypothetical protein